MFKNTTKTYLTIPSKLFNVQYFWVNYHDLIKKKILIRSVFEIRSVRTQIRSILIWNSRIRSILIWNSRITFFQIGIDLIHLFLIHINSKLGKHDDSEHSTNQFAQKQTDPIYKFSLIFFHSLLPGKCLQADLK